MNVYQMFHPCLLHVLLVIPGFVCLLLFFVGVFFLGGRGGRVVICNKHLLDSAVCKKYFKESRSMIFAIQIFKLHITCLCFHLLIINSLNFRLLLDAWITCFSLITN